ncbi:hypothetical protein GCM10009730_63060 [Streptomyces albidochromogenes]
MTPQANPFAPTRRTRRTFEETVQLLELFLHREGRAPTAREEITVDGDTVKIGPWFAKARTSTAAASSTPGTNASWPLSSTATGPTKTRPPPSPDPQAQPQAIALLTCL